MNKLMTLAATTLGSVFIVGAANAQLAPRAQDELRIHYMNVGAGTCTVVECPGLDAPPMIIDCGSIGASSQDMTKDQAGKYIAKVLEPHSARPNLVISHPHKDHYAWIADVLKNVQTQNIWLGGKRSGYGSWGFSDWLIKQVANGATVFNDQVIDADFHNDGAPMADSELSCGNALVYTLTVNTGPSPNSKSHILEIRYNDFGATFTGDAEGKTENKAVENYTGNVKTTVLSASHHGASSHKSNGKKWIEATDPEVVIFSTGPKFGHPRCNVVKRYEDSVLAAAPAHPTRCGDNQGFRREERSRDAKYVTAVNGMTVVTTRGNSPLSLHCDGSRGCEANIEH